MLRGGPLAEYLNGGDGSDIVYGRSGTDYLWDSGTRGYDVAYGGANRAYCLEVEERHRCPVWQD